MGRVKKAVADGVCGVKGRGTGVLFYKAALFGRLSRVSERMPPIALGTLLVALLGAPPAPLEHSPLVAVVGFGLGCRRLRRSPLLSSSSSSSRRRCRGSPAPAATLGRPGALGPRALLGGQCLFLGEPSGLGLSALRGFGGGGGGRGGGVPAALTHGLQAKKKEKERRTVDFKSGFRRGKSSSG